MTNRNINQYWAQTADVGVMICRCSLDSQHGGSDCILQMVAVLVQGTQMILLSGTQTMNKTTTHIRNHSVENGRGKITN